MDGQPELTLAQMKKYLDRRIGELVTVFRALEAQDPAVLREIFHRWKGNAQLYGFSEIGLSAARVVRLIDTKPIDWEKIADEVGSIAARVDEETAALQTKMTVN